MEEQVNRIDSSWEELMNLTRDLDDDQIQMRGVVGNWSTKDTLAHISFWEDRFADVTEGKLEQTVPEGQTIDDLNAEVAADRQGWPIDKVWQELERSHDRVHQLVETVPNLDERRVEILTWGHYDGHAEDIRAWRERVNI